MEHNEGNSKYIFLNKNEGLLVDFRFYFCLNKAKKKKEKKK